MDVEKLKQKILDLAIRGKLVPQDPNDEPASVLIEKIRAEKESLIKQGKIKRDKNESYIFKGDDNSYYENTNNKTTRIDIELPFTIPSSWCWQRLISVCSINPPINAEDTLEVSFIAMKDIQAGFLNSFSFNKIEWTNVKNNFTHFQNEDIGLAKITPCFENRKSVIFRNLINGIGAGTTELNIIRVDKRVLCNEYLLYLLKSDYLIKYGISKFTGAVGQQRFGGIALKQFLIPIPPLEEQKRLCDIIISSMQLANNIGDDFDTLEKDCDTLRYKILDLFFSENSRYKSYYTEKPLNEVAKIVFGQSPNGTSITTEQVDDSIEFHQGKTSFGKYYLDESNRWCVEPTKITNGNSIVMSVRAPVGDVNICKRIICVGRGLCSIEPYSVINEKYLFYLLLSKKQYLESKSTGSTFSAVTSKIVKEMNVVVCEVDIQKMIVENIEKTFALIDDIVAQ